MLASTRELRLLDNTDIDGIFGPVTEHAVRGFQEAVGIETDGVVGPRTWARLPEAFDLPVLRRGSTGEAVRRLQRGLDETSKATDVKSPGGADGDFGPRTDESVRSFQRYAEISVDGVVGDHTWYAQVGGTGRLLHFAGWGT